jgi:diguanylate cyclase (GGDEF)-like protein
VEEPYTRLLLVPVIFVAATQPPRHTAVFMLAVLAVLVAPLVFDRWDEDIAAGSIASFVVWTGIAVAGNLLMSGVRAQRLSMAAGQAQAQHEARIDSLTGLHNRRAFDEDLDRAVNASGRMSVPLSLAMIDIVCFKEVNDQWGYTEGDRTLREFADVLGSTVRNPDQCYRWGGDEFCVILTGTPSQKTEAIAERLRLRVEERLKRPDGEPIRIRFAVAEHEREQTARELADMAGMALTSAKLGASR